jgi:cytochrome b561
MSEGFSPVIFLYGMALVVAMGKAFTLLIWRTLPKPRPPLRQEMLEAWQRRTARVQAAKEAAREKPPAAC